MDKEFQEQLREILDTFSEREKRIIILRFGLEDGQPHTPEELEEIGVTRERMRQIEYKVIRRLGLSRPRKKYRDYLE